MKDRKELTYDTKLARQAQTEYCLERGLPKFVDGECYSCGRDIYAEGGISVEKAESQLITGCPWCHHSFVS